MWVCVRLCRVIGSEIESFRVANNCLDWEAGPCCVASFPLQETAMLGFDPFCAMGVGLELPDA